jgi:hypothetical protein
MGGYGSGRRGGSPTSESLGSYVLNISVLKANLRKGGRVASATLLPDGTSPILIAVDTTDPSAAYIELHHQTRDGRRGDQWVRDRIHLSQTVPTYGGSRWWFLCPATGRRTTKLFLPNGGSHFRSRQAHGLGYACQREDPFSRLQRRAAILNQQLGGDGWGSWNIPPPKPKWMHWRTYARKYERWRRAVEKADQEFVRLFVARPRRVHQGDPSHNSAADEGGRSRRFRPGEAHKP